MTSTPTTYAGSRYLYLGDSVARRTFPPLPAGRYRVKCEVRVWSVSFAITVNGVVVQTHSRSQFVTGEPLFFSTDDVITLEAAGVIAIAFEADAVGEVTILPL